MHALHSLLKNLVYQSLSLILSTSLCLGETIQVTLTRNENLRTLGTQEETTDTLMIRALLPKGTVIEVDLEKFKELENHPENFNKKYAFPTTDGTLKIENSKYGFLSGIKIISIPDAYKNTLNAENLNHLSNELFFSARSIRSKTDFDKRTQATVTQDLPVFSSGIFPAGLATLDSQSLIQNFHDNQTEIESAIKNGTVDRLRKKAAQTALEDQNLIHLIGEISSQLNGQLLLPLVGRAEGSCQAIKETSRFGSRPDPLNPSEKDFHAGIDIIPKNGSLDGIAVAAFDGVVLNVGISGGYGNRVEILHSPGNVVTQYAHLNPNSKEYQALRKNFNKARKTNEKLVVKKGDLLAGMGNTGTRSTGPHLHFETRILQPKYDAKGRADGVESVPVDPSLFYNRIGQQLA
jgi:murein DD-endopeptidase MepM/ murein hydrolase activator NlpD